MVGRRRVRMVIGAVGVSLAVMSAPLACADPAPPPDPAVLLAQQAMPAAAPVSPPDAAPVTPPDGVPHLPSPENLPPGTTQAQPEHPKLGYLRDIWNAVRGKDLSASDALLLIAQRPVDPGKVAASVPSNQVVPVLGEPAAPPAPAAPPTAAQPTLAPAESAIAAAP